MASHRNELPHHVATVPTMLLKHVYDNAGSTVELCKRRR